MNPTWPAALDAFERHLDLQNVLLDAGRYDEVVAFAPHADLPPLPWVFVVRASGLLDRAQALVERAGAMRDDTRKRLAQPRRLAFAGLPVPGYVDQQA